MKTSNKYIKISYEQKMIVTLNLREVLVIYPQL